MTKAAQRLSSAWQMVSDGTHPVLVDLRSVAMARVHIGNGEPDADSDAWHRLAAGDPPMSYAGTEAVWARADGDGAEVVVTEVI